jgi:hypothetical protein
MHDNEYQTVARVIAASALARTGAGAAAALRVAFARSRIATMVDAFRRHVNETSAEHRVRLAGVVLLAANVTQSVLVRIEPSLVRPAPLPLLRIEAAMLALVLIVAAPHVVHAWGQSHVKRLTFGRRADRQRS